MKFPLATLLLLLSFSCFTQVTMIESSQKPGKFKDYQFGLEIKHAYWKDNNYHIKFVITVDQLYDFKKSIEFKDGKLNLKFAPPNNDPPSKFNETIEFYYQIKGLKDKNFKLRFNGDRQGSISMSPPPIVEEEPEEEPPLVFVATEAFWPGCMDGKCTEFEVRKYISKHIKYPAAAREYEIQGRVQIRFKVAKDGSIQEIKVLKSPHDLLSKEAIRTIKKFPKWIPAKQQGRRVATFINLPINFNLK